MAEKCEECGCVCVNCSTTGLKKIHNDDDDDNNGEMHLHLEIENLRQRLFERDSHIVTMETQFLNEADKFPNGELASMKEEMLKWQDKYTRLYESHKRVQKVNQNLEDKLLRIVDKCETEKSAFTKDIATLSHRLADANYTIHRLTQDNEKYRNDVNLAIQLLQCKPSNFVGQRYDSLPSEVQAKVRSYVAQKRVSSSNESSISVAGVTSGVSENFKSITVPISTFPPTAMVYNVTKTSNIDKDSDEESDDSKPPVDIVSAAIMAKVLEERERERVFAKHCDTCTCHRSILTNDVETQTFEDNYNRDDDNDNNDDDIDEKKKTTFYNENNVLCNSEFDNGDNSENIADHFNITTIINRQYCRQDFIANDPINNGAAGSVNGKLRNNIDVEYIDERKTRKKNLGNGKILTKDKKTSTTSTTTTSCQYSPINKKNALSTSSNIKENEKLSNRETSRVSLLKKGENQQQESHQHQQKNEQSVNTVYRLKKTKSEWTKYEKLPSQEIDLIDLKNGVISETEIDLINKRILRNNDYDNVLSQSSQENRQMITDFINVKSLSINQKQTTTTTTTTIINGEENNDLNIINDRVWKKNNSIDENCGSSSRSDSGLGIPIKSLPLTLIEVKNSPAKIYKTKNEKTIKDKESSIVLDLQSEDTASPSFSSDSLLISSSDPPSTSSEFCNPTRPTAIQKTSINNNNNININNNNNINNTKNNFPSSKSLMSNWQDRTTGPRGCSMRITPGSKNILLDNAGNYKTILYTSGTNNGYNNHFKTHNNVGKSDISGESTSTSTSTSSEDNSPVLPNDNSQLQRVAEWIKASGPLDVDHGMGIKSVRYVESVKKSDDDDVDVDANVDVISVDKLDNELRKIKNDDDDNDDRVHVEIKETNDKSIENNEIMILDKNFVSSDDVDNSFGFNIVNKENDSAADLIIFESSNDYIDVDDNNKKLLSTVDSCKNITKDDRFNFNIKSNESLSSTSVSNIIDVKITREMEETYLKLAASLDPANLKLSNSDNTDITLEKYRKKYKKK